MLLKVDCLPNAVGKQPSIPSILSWSRDNLGTVKLMMMMDKNLCLVAEDSCMIVNFNF